MDSWCLWQEREGQREETMGKKRVGLTNTEAALAGWGVTGVNGTQKCNLTKTETIVC